MTATTSTGEHFCTMFDARFLALGLALYESLLRQSPDSTLWVLCLDRETEAALAHLSLPGLAVIALEAIETDSLRTIRAERTAREYYWTLTPCLLEAVLERAHSASRVTYLDADLYFFLPPHVLLEQMASQHDVLITHHAYAPEYEHHASTSGPYCVQFLTIGRSEPARRVLSWWRDRCAEWCYDRHEDGRFGDQRYLEQWPAMLGDRLLVINRPDLTGAPWNARLADHRDERRWRPVFYHFHGFRHLSDDRALLFPLDYEIGRKPGRLYREYIRAVRRTVRLGRAAGSSLSGMPTPIGLEEFDGWPKSFRALARRVRRRLWWRLPEPIVSIR